MLFKIASIAFFMAWARADDEEVDFEPKDCEYAFDFYFYALTEIMQYTTAARCNYVDLRDDEGDITLSWEYECERNGDVTLTLYDGSYQCIESDGVNKTVWEAFYPAAAENRDLFMCSDASSADNCAVKVGVTEPCSGTTDVAVEIWPTKDICVGYGNQSIFYRCNDYLEKDTDRYYGTVRATTDCSVDPNGEDSDEPMYEDGCVSDTMTEITCNSATRFGFSLVAFASLVFALLR